MFTPGLPSPKSWFHGKLIMTGSVGKVQAPMYLCEEDRADRHHVHDAIEAPLEEHSITCVLWDLWGPLWD
jgi:hypothetical protein